MAPHPKVGVVVPGYGHPRFLAEALLSVCEQTCEFYYQIVVVDDGCRFEETAEVVANFLDLYPGKMHYLRHPNAKLPGARNAGVRFLLNLAPEIEAIYFLDADNRLEPYSLQAFWDALGDDPSIGWAYPDISFFGQVWNAEGFDTRETAPRYKRLLHLVGNVSEAGSMVRADAFREGVFYDDTMRSGYEDWEFWLSMIDAGYEGVPVHQAGFSYRRRPESMLAGSRRLEESLIAYIREKHTDLFAVRNLLTLEHQTAPAFAVILCDEEQVLSFSDPLNTGEATSLQQFEREVTRWHSSAKEYFFPQKLLVMTRRQWTVLAEQAYHLRWLFWCLRGLSAGLHSVAFEAGPTMKCEGRPWGTSNLDNRICCISADKMRALLDDCQAIASISNLPAAQKVHIETPNPLLHGSSGEEADQAFGALVKLSALGGRVQTARHMHRRYAGPNHQALRETLIEPLCAFEEQVPIPVGHARPRVTVIVETAVANSAFAQDRLETLMTAIVAAGAEVAVVQEFHTDFDDSWQKEKSWARHVTDVFPLLQRGNHEEFKMYLGRRISARLPMSSKADVSTIARVSDFVVSIGAAGSLEVLGEIKGFGPKTIVWLEPEFEGVEKGESLAKMLAYEHAIDMLISDDAGFRSRLSGQGVPPGKVFATNTLIDQKITELLKS